MTRLRYGLSLWLCLKDELQIDMVQHEIKNEILSTLTNSLKLYKVILFGSSAAGKEKKDSDIDLIVVTDDDFMPKNYEENMKNYLKVSAVLRDIKTRLPIDLIVHTKPMHEKFIHLGSMFSKNVMNVAGRSLVIQ